MLLFLVKVAGVSAGFVLADQIYDTVYTEMMSATMLFDESDPTNPATIAWTKTQTKLRCCGIDGIDSWRGNSALHAAANGSVPRSCCVFPSHCCGCSAFNSRSDYRYQISNQNNLYTSGCTWSNKYRLQTLLTALGAVSAAVAILELTLVFLGICLACGVRYCDRTLPHYYSTNAYGGDVTTKSSAMSTCSQELLQPLLPE
jgi:hypothetical protein